MKKNLFIILSLSALLLAAIACSGSNPVDPSGQNALPDVPAGGNFSNHYCFYFDATDDCGWDGDFHVNFVQDETVLTVTLFTDSTGLGDEPWCANDVGSPSGSPVLTGTIDPLTADFTVSGSEDAMTIYWSCGSGSATVVMSGNLITLSGTLTGFHDTCFCTFGDQVIHWDLNTVGYNWCTVGAYVCDPV